MDIITGYTGVKHITAEQDRDINIGVFGEESYVLSTGLKMKSEISSNNEIKIRDGVLMHQGCAASIKKNTYDSVTITNGSQGMQRIDLIVARYERNEETGVEEMNFVVIQGTPAEADPTVPEYIVGDIQAGDAIADMPMYEVVIEGLNITAVNEVFTVLDNRAEITKLLAELNSNMCKNEFSSRVAIANNESFTPDSDGYISINMDYDSTSSYCRVLDKNDNVLLQLASGTATRIGSSVSSMFLRKGITITFNSNKTAGCTCFFYPLV